MTWKLTNGKERKNLEMKVWKCFKYTLGNFVFELLNVSKFDILHWEKIVVRYRLCVLSMSTFGEYSFWKSSCFQTAQDVFSEKLKLSMYMHIYIYVYIYIYICVGYIRVQLLICMFFSDELLICMFFSDESHCSFQF